MLFDMIKLILKEVVVLTESIIKFLIIVLFLLILIYPSALCWNYSINTWLDFAEKEKEISMTACYILAVVPGLGQFGIPLAAATFIIKMFL